MRKTACRDCEKSWLNIYPFPYCPHCGSMDVYEVPDKPGKKKRLPGKGPVIASSDIEQWDGSEWDDETNSENREQQQEDDSE